MATREELINFVKANFNCEVDGGIISLNYSFKDGRTQFVHAEVSEEWIRVLSPFATADSITAMRALQLNESIFGLDLINDYYFLVNVLFLQDIDASEVSAGLESVAYWADKLENKINFGDNY